MGWTDVPFLAVDTETTGVDCWNDRVVEIAAVIVNPDGSTGQTVHRIIDPGVEIPDAAAEIHGVTTDRARSEGVAPAVAFAEVAALIDARKPGVPVVIYNARFDWPLILTEAVRHGIDGFPPTVPVLDPFLIDRMVDKYRRGKRTLSVVAAHYGVPLGDAAHGALADAIAAAQVMRAITQRHPKVAEHSLASMHLRQIHGHERDRVGFVDYMRINKDPAFDTPAGWPIPVTAP